MRTNTHTHPYETGQSGTIGCHGDMQTRCIKLHGERVHGVRVAAICMHTQTVSIRTCVYIICGAGEHIPAAKKQFEGIFLAKINTVNITCVAFSPAC